MKRVESRRRASFWLLLALLAMSSSQASAQEVEVDRPEAPRLDPLEVDANGDGVPDGWYNLRDCVWAKGGVSPRGSHCFRFENPKPGRPARTSRAFGVDGRKVEALLVGIWVRVEKVGPGQRLGDEPGLVIDFLGDQLRAVKRASLGPWTKTIGTKWTHVVKRISIPPGTRDAILSVGLLGGTGVLEVDDLTIEPIPIGTSSGVNLVINGDFELGDPAPAGWMTENGAARVFPGHESISAVELSRAGSRLLTGIGVPVDGLNALKVSVAVHRRDLRGADAVSAAMFFLDADGRSVVPQGGNLPIFRFGGSSPWTTEETIVNVPNGAVRAVLQFEKSHATGAIQIDDVIVMGNPQPDPAEWKPFHVETKKADWMPVEGAKQIVAGSALDASALLQGAAGGHGFVTVKNGRLTFQDGTRARFFGVQLLPPAAFQDTERTDALVDHLARSGVNLVRLGELDTPLGPDRSLFDDSRDDTKELDPIALGRFDHLIAALKSRGIYVALEFQAMRRFRFEDDVPTPELLGYGGGPGAIVDPKLHAALLKAAEQLLGHVNSETGIALKDDPMLAWFTLFGEISLYDLIDDPNALPPSIQTALKSKGVAGRSGWRAVESAALKELADSLRAKGLRVPIAGVSHWRREADFALTVTAPGLDLVDDRLFWTPPTFLSPNRRSLLLNRDGGLLSAASKKRKTDRPYVVGQWCDQTSGAWSLPYEAGDMMMTSVLASSEDWDAIVRRGVFVNPQVWGAAAPGTSGGEDLFQLPEIANAVPPVFALLPHAASVYLRREATSEATGPARKGTKPAAGLPGWDSRNGRLLVDTPHTQAIAGWYEDESGRFPALTLESKTPFSVVAVSSFAREPIATSKRLLVTAVARVEPTGLEYVDEWKREVSNAGRPPLLQEPVRARITWRRGGSVKAYALDNEGKRTGAAVLEKSGDASVLVIDGMSPGLHWELVAE